jgi:hypothetical protein
MSASQQSSNSSQLLGDQRSEPVAPATSLNDRLQAQHTDVPEDDDSIQANLVRTICQVRTRQRILYTCLALLGGVGVLRISVPV